jgi:hypothetical protein
MHRKIVEDHPMDRGQSQWTEATLVADRVVDLLMPGKSLATLHVLVAISACELS